MLFSIYVIINYMCSFLVTSKDINSKDLEKANFYQKLRGPDLTNIFKQHGVTFVHNLLSITGLFTKQPFVDMEHDIVCIFNGEIYNYKTFSDKYTSDGECLIPCYLKHGETFFKQLDGEFAIVLIDFKNNKIIFGSDTFGTKPIFFSFENESYGMSTYESCLKILGFKQVHRVYGNYFYIADTNKKSLSLHRVTEFDLDNEYKKDFNDWNAAFERSILKRANNVDKKVFIGLSEGFDSGTICTSLLKNNLNFKAFSVNVKTPPSNVLLWRHGTATKPLPVVENIQIETPNIIDKEYMNLSFKELKEIKDSIYSLCEDYRYFYFDEGKFKSRVCRETYGFLGAGAIFSKAKKEGYKICLSGLAGDIIGNKNINQLFKKLNDINGVIDFDDNNIYSCEFCCGLHGLEVRYPYLDKEVWQETLWLDKNIYQHFKQPQRQYMLANKFPFVDIDNQGKEIFEKVGFYKPLPTWFFKI